MLVCWVGYRSKGIKWVAIKRERPKGVKVVCFYFLDGSETCVHDPLNNFGFERKCFPDQKFLAQAPSRAIYCGYEPVIEERCKPLVYPS